MIFFRVIRWIVWKDLISEIRSRENISSMFFFALIIILIFSLSLSMDQEMVKEMIPGILWIAF
ncbi:MAG TPA: heme exporter protein CcmB, partial [Nitrospirota bacterium]|nr:heme exporter protein CcmB [Nitrospirota bacterium]